LELDPFAIKLNGSYLEINATLGSGFIGVRERSFWQIKFYSFTPEL